MRSEGRYFQLTPQLLDLGYAYLASQPWWRYAQHVVERLATEIQSACAVTVLDQASIVYVAYASAARFSMFSRSIGARLPAHATAGGRVLLAALSAPEIETWLEAHELPRLTPYTVTDPVALKAILAKVAGEGFATINQEVVLGLHTIGVPIFDRGRRVAAALSVSVQELGAAKIDLVSRFLKPMQRASGEITSGLPT